MSTRNFINPNMLSVWVVQSRLRQTDPESVARAYDVLIRDPDSGQVTAVKPYVEISECSLTDQQINDLLAQSITAEEISVLDGFVEAVGNYLALGADWVTMPVDDLITNSQAAFFGGKDRTEVQTLIDQANTVQKIQNNVLTPLATTMYAQRDREIKMIKALCSIRDYIIVPRR